MVPSRILRVLRHLAGLGIPGRLRAPENVHLGLPARIAVQQTGRHEVVVAFAYLARHARAAPAAKPHGEASRAREIEAIYRRFAGQPRELGLRDEYVGGVCAACCLAAARAMAIAE